MLPRKSSVPSSTDVMAKRKGWSTHMVKDGAIMGDACRGDTYRRDRGGFGTFFIHLQSGLVAD